MMKFDERITTNCCRSDEQYSSNTWESKSYLRFSARSNGVPYARQETRLPDSIWLFRLYLLYSMLLCTELNPRLTFTVRIYRFISHTDCKMMRIPVSSIQCRI